MASLALEAEQCPPGMVFCEGAHMSGPSVEVSLVPEVRLMNRYDCERLLEENRVLCSRREHQVEVLANSVRACFLAEELKLNHYLGERLVQTTKLTRAYLQWRIRRSLQRIARLQALPRQN